MNDLIEQTIQGFEEKFPVSHYYCEDSWYSCPLAEGGTAREDVTECDCGAVFRHERAKAFIRRAMEKAYSEGQSNLLRHPEPDLKFIGIPKVTNSQPTNENTNT